MAWQKTVSNFSPTSLLDAEIKLVEFFENSGYHDVGPIAGGIRSHIFVSETINNETPGVIAGKDKSVVSFRYSGTGDEWLFSHSMNIDEELIELSHEYLFGLGQELADTAGSALPAELVWTGAEDYDDSTYPQLGRVAQIDAGSYLQFSATSLPQDTFFPTSGKWTIDVLARSPSSFSTSWGFEQTNGNDILLFDRDGGGSSPLRMIFYNDAGVQQALHTLSGSDTNALNHWMVTYDGTSTLTFYFDGAQVGTQSFSGWDSFTNPIRFTNGAGGGGHWRIDALRFWVGVEKDIGYHQSRNALVTDGIGDLFIDRTEEYPINIKLGDVNQRTTCNSDGYASPTNVLGAWNFDGGTTPQDLVGSSNFSAIGSGAWNTASGVVVDTSASGTSDTQRLAAPVNASIKAKLLAGNWTIYGWFKFNATVSADHHIYGFGDILAESFALRRNPASLKLQFVSVGGVDGVTDVNVGTEYNFFAITHNGSQFEIFMGSESNPVLSEITKIEAVADPALDSWVVGNRNHFSSVGNDFLIDNVRFVDSDLDITVLETLRQTSLTTDIVLFSAGESGSGANIVARNTDVHLGQGQFDHVYAGNIPRIRTSFISKLTAGVSAGTTTLNFDSIMPNDKDPNFDGIQVLFDPNPPNTRAVLIDAETGIYQDIIILSYTSGTKTCTIQPLTYDAPINSIISDIPISHGAGTITSGQWDPKTDNGPIGFFKDEQGTHDTLDEGGVTRNNSNGVFGRSITMGSGDNVLLAPAGTESDFELDIFTIEVVGSVPAGYTTAGNDHEFITNQDGSNGYRASARVSEAMQWGNRGAGLEFDVPQAEWNPLNDGSIHHWCFGLKFDTNFKAFWFTDGQEASVSPSSGNASVPTNSVNALRLNNGSANFVPFTHYVIRFWSRALKDYEILELSELQSYNVNLSSVNTDGLIAEWRFNEGVFKPNSVMIPEIDPEDLKKDFNDAFEGVPIKVVAQENRTLGFVPNILLHGLESNEPVDLAQNKESKFERQDKDGGSEDRVLFTPNDSVPPEDKIYSVSKTK